jgi:5-deoxy-glucuronate isomerase
MPRIAADNPVHAWHSPAGTATAPDYRVHLDPTVGALDWAGLRVLDLAVGGSAVIGTGDLEMAALPISGSCTIEVGSHRFVLRGREHVFHAISDFAYLPIDTEFKVTAIGGAPLQLAVPSARATKRFEPAFVAAEAVPVEIRGAGQSTRQLANFMAPGVFDGAERLMCVEVITPDGNWSSYPPHRHDGIGGCTVNNEEIYYFRIGSTAHTGYSPDGFAMHRTYTVAGDVDVNVAVYDEDVFSIPRGYHGPCVAAPGYPLYYLNILAGTGPSPVRDMSFCDDPTHHWVRDSWNGMSTDPRVPMTSAAGPCARERAMTPPVE